VVGHVPVTDNDLSVATDLASVTTPTRDFEADPAIAGEDAADDSTPGSTGQSSGWSTTTLVVGGAAALTLAGALIVTLRRRRAGARPN